MSDGVLIVDDDAALAENLAEIVEGLGAKTTVARDRKSALATAAGRDFDVALIDVRLPDGDGISLLGPLRAASHFTQLVLVTGDATLEGAMAAVRSGAFAYVLKPVSPPDLLDTVSRARQQAALYRERERLRLELELSERRNRDLVESVPAFVLALDADGRIVTWNRSLEEITGFTRAEMLGTPGLKLVSPDERPSPLAGKAGAARQVRWRKAEASGSTGARSVYIGIDVTDEQEMLRRTLRAERLAAVGTLAAGLAHEVRNPLNSASLQLTLLQRRLERGEGPDATTPIARIIKEEIERLDRLVRDFLAFAQPRTLQAQPVDVADVFAKVVALLHPEADAAHVMFVVETPAAPLTASGDPERLRQVLLNLTRNALEAMQGRAGHITLRARGAAGGVEIDVADDGPGFPEELPIFDAFFTTKPHGTGLGLALTHRIVTDHGGTIRVRSKPGDTCFTITLPSV